MDRHRLALQVLAHDRPGGIGAEGHDARQHLIEDDAQGVDVRADVNPPTLRLLRRNVMRAAHEQAGLSESGHGDVSGDAEIHDFHRAIGRDHEVLRLDIAVDDAMLVSRLQSCGHLSGDVQGLMDGKRPSLLDQLLHRDPGHVFHDQEVNTPLVAEFQYPYHVRIVQKHGCSSLAMKTLDVLLILRQVRVHDLDGHHRTGPRITGLIYGCHAAHAYFVQYLVVFQSPGYH